MKNESFWYSRSTKAPASHLLDCRHYRENPRSQSNGSRRNYCQQALVFQWPEVPGDLQRDPDTARQVHNGHSRLKMAKTDGKGGENGARRKGFSLARAAKCPLFRSIGAGKCSRFVFLCCRLVYMYVCFFFGSGFVRFVLVLFLWRD